MYNDFQITDNCSAQAMRQKFNEIKCLEYDDLKEIQDKLTEQKNLLISHNNGGNFSNAINQIDNSISLLKDIINKNNIHTGSYTANPLKQTNKAVFFNRTYSLFNPTGAYGKIRSENETLAHSTPNNTPDNTPNLTPLPPTNSNPNNSFQPGINNPNNNYTPISPPASQITSRKRNSPLQSSFINNLAKSLFLRKKPIIKANEKYQNRYHINQEEHCPINKKIVNNQVDLIRLILLFIALRPNCNYLPKIARIANSQFEVLLNLMP